jgi:hypothetical protein
MWEEKGENWDLCQDSPDEEDWEVQSYEIEVTFRGVELRRMASGVTCRVWVLSLSISDDQKQEEND